MSHLVSKHCTPCAGKTLPLSRQEMEPLFSELQGWVIVDHHHLTKTYTFKNFVEALQFVNQVGAIAETEGHHPDLYLTWGKVEVKWWTHKINGLTQSDFIMAAKCDHLKGK